MLLSPSTRCAAVSIRHPTVPRFRFWAYQAKRDATNKCLSTNSDEPVVVASPAGLAAEKQTKKLAKKLEVSFTAVTLFLCMHLVYGLAADPSLARPLPTDSHCVPSALTVRTCASVVILACM